MILWIDAQLSPALAPWIEESFDVRVQSVKRLGLRDASDREIFEAARLENAVVLTKDHDFVELVVKLGPPPAIQWLTSGNTSNTRVRELLERAWPRIRRLLDSGEALIELRNGELPAI